MTHDQNLAVDIVGTASAVVAVAFGVFASAWLDCQEGHQASPPRATAMACTVMNASPANIARLSRPDVVWTVRWPRRGLVGPVEASRCADAGA